MSEPTNAMRRRLDDRELAEFRKRGKVKTLGGFTLAALIADANEIGLGPDEVEVCGTAVGGSYAIELWAVEPDDEEEGSDV